MADKIKTGTTTIGLVVQDAVILASDSKASMGHLNYDEEANKVFKITDYLGLTIAGSVGDALTIVRFLRTQAKIYEMERESKMTPKAAATLLSNILNANRYYPYFVQFLIGGVNDYPSLYDLDLSGGLLPREKYAITGSGTELALATLDNIYKEGMTEDEGIGVAVKTIMEAKRRDNFSGGVNINLLVISKKGTRELSKTEVEKYIKKNSI